MREIPYINPYKSQGHGCDVLLIGCMDFRFHQYLTDTLRSLLDIDDLTYDYRGVVGGSKSLLDPIGRRSVFKSISLARKKHDITLLILAEHIDCGGYGGSDKHANIEEEEKFHIAQLRKAKQIITKRFPDLKTVLVYQDWHTIKMVR